MVAKLTGREFRVHSLLILEKGTFVFWRIYSVAPEEGKMVNAGLSGTYWVGQKVCMGFFCKIKNIFFIFTNNFIDLDILSMLALPTTSSG